MGVKNKQKIVKTKNTYSTLSWVHIFVIVFFAISMGVVLKKFLVVGNLAHVYADQSLLCPTPVAGVKSLQLQPCYPTYPVTPQPVGPRGTTTYCQSDSVQTNNCTCPSYEEPDSICADPKCIANGGFPSGKAFVADGAALPPGANCSYAPGTKVPSGLSCAVQCNSKPIIYLYSDKPLQADVSLNIPGVVTVSDPLYPSSGWKNVGVHADGSLLYNGQVYTELYYESATIKATAPTTGFIIKKADLEPELVTFTKKLGLVGREQQEFVNYWVTRLEGITTPYIFVSIFTPHEKEKVDTVVILPKPDTRIEFLAYFKPVEQPYQVQPLLFPPLPQRKGFVEIEWGGTIDN